MNIELAREVLWRFFRREGRLPSYGEMCPLFGYSSKNAAFRLTKKLIDEGYIEKSGSGKLVPKRLSMPLKILGSVQAGFPTPSEEAHLDTISLDEYMVPNPEMTFLLRVSGDSMIDEGIKPGDLVIVDRGREARNGDIVLARLDGEWTLKFLQKRGSFMRLIAANEKYPPFEPRQELTLGGVVVGVLRRYAAS